MTVYLLDTNHVSALLDGNEGIRERLVGTPPHSRFGITTSTGRTKTEKVPHSGNGCSNRCRGPHVQSENFDC